MYFFLNVLARFQIEPLQSGAVMKFDGDEKATHERPIRLVNECIGDLSPMHIGLTGFTTVVVAGNFVYSESQK